MVARPLKLGVQPLESCQIELPESLLMAQAGRLWTRFAFLLFGGGAGDSVSIFSDFLFM